ncbi:MAG TPA: glycosyltransferase [Novosphingobium sp.]|nr:glycosyltransferase [Novosphingobium sp.]
MSPAARHILICFHDFSRGGTERIAIGLARHWVKRGRKVTILCGTSEGGLRDTVDPRVQVIELDPPVRRSLTSRIHLGRAMAARIPDIAPDVVFLPGNFHLPLVIPFGKMPNRPAVVVKISNPTVPTGLLALPVRMLLRRYRHDVDAVCAMNSGLERDLRAMLPGLPVSTLHDPVYLHHDSDDAPLPANDGRLHILWAGRFEPQKDAPLALRTIAALNERVPAHLTMLGDGALHERIVSEIGRQRLGDLVSAPGYVAGIDGWLRRSDALLVSSRFEGGPAVAVEALAHGVPVVSTDCSHFLRDIITCPEAGAIVPSRDPAALAGALAEVCARGRPEPDVLQPLVASLDPAACADAYLDCFDMTVAGRRAAFL